MSDDFDTTRLTLLLSDLRLPALKQIWPTFAERSDQEGWPAARLLMALAEHEIAERDRRRIERHLGEAKLLPGKTLDNFDFDAVPMVSKAQVAALCAGDGWLRNGANLLLIGPPGGGKSHLSSAIGLGLLEKGWKVLFARTSDLVQRLQVARRELALEAAINRLDRFDLVILDDFAYVTKDQAETSVLFELISARYERRSLLVTANQPFGWRQKLSSAGVRIGHRVTDSFPRGGAQRTVVPGCLAYLPTCAASAPPRSAAPPGRARLSSPASARLTGSQCGFDGALRSAVLPGL